MVCMPASPCRCLISLECVKAWGGTCPERVTGTRIAFAFFLIWPLCSADEKCIGGRQFEAVAVSEGVPYRISQELPGILSNKGEFATKCAVSPYNRELLKDSGFKLIKPIKLLEVDNDLVFFS